MALRRAWPPGAVEPRSAPSAAAAWPGEVAEAGLHPRPPRLHRPPAKEAGGGDTGRRPPPTPPLRRSCRCPEARVGDSRPPVRPGRPGQRARHPSAALGGGGPGWGLPGPQETALPPHQRQARGPRRHAELRHSWRDTAHRGRDAQGSSLSQGEEGTDSGERTGPGEPPTRSVRCPLRAVTQDGTRGALPARAHRARVRFPPGVRGQAPSTGWLSGGCPPSAAPAETS